MSEVIKIFQGGCKAAVLPYSIYLNAAPDEATYPVSIFSVKSVSDDYSDTKNYEAVDLTLTTYGKSPRHGISRHKTLESLLDRTHLQVTDPSNNKRVICCSLISNDVTADENCYKCVSVFRFSMEQDK